MNTEITVRSVVGLPLQGPLRVLSILIATASIAACEDAGGGTTNPDVGGDTDVVLPNPDGIPYGDECGNHGECSTEFCTTISPTSPDAFCSVRCSEDSDCPQGEVASECIFVQREGRLSQVCAPSELCIDRDGDGYGTGPGCIAADCDDTNAAIYPGALEVCDGLDNNCDDLIDVNTTDTGGACDTGYEGVCQTGLWVCESGQRHCRANVLPGVRQEICDGLDNDCDGKTDEGPGHPDDDDFDPFDSNFISQIGRSCGNDGNDCFTGHWICDSELSQLQCDGTTNPRDVPDLCDYIDNDCDGEIDEDYREDYPNYGTPCQAGIGTCRAAGVYGCHPDNPAAPPVCNAVPNEDNATAEICNNFDDDCDGEVDEDFRNSDGVYDQDEHCGRCNLNCADTWAPSPEANNVIPTCDVSGLNATCGFTCAPGFVDFDGIGITGCEFEPDLDAIYVASLERGGENSGNCGTYDVPCLTIAHAITRANDEDAARIRVGEGTFDGGFTLETPIQILGGHSSRTWERNAAVNMSALRGGANEGSTSYSVRIRNLTGAANTAELSGFTIEAPDAQAASGNSIGVWIINSDNTLVLRDNTILAGRGGSGAAGAGGSNGQQGASGQAGSDRVNDQSSCSETGGVALAGGASGTNVCGGEDVSVDGDGVGDACDDDVDGDGEDVSGGSGASSNCPSTSFGPINSNGGTAAPGNGCANSGGRGNPGDSTSHYTTVPPQHDVFGCAVDPTNPIASPTPGIAGGDGSDGARGNGAGQANGSVVSHTWVGNSGQNAAPGANGAGGGGGGSSGGIYQNRAGYPTLYHYGATGGGGGAGGCGATGGQGGQGGGGSFGILMSGSGSNIPTIADNELHRGSGGRGGQGGIGGVGGAGGGAGSGGEHTHTTQWSRCGQHAADGGAGGRGGHGGGGGGGAGGVAYDVAIAGYTTTTIPASNVSIVPSSVATGGAAGAGGGAIVNPGSAGVTGSSGRLLSFAP